MHIPHKHAEIIKAWADGAHIQWRFTDAEQWKDLSTDSPRFDELLKYRIKHAAPVIETKMTAAQCRKVLGLALPAFSSVMASGSLPAGIDYAFVCLANAAILKAIADGQVMVADHLEAAQVHAMKLVAARALLERYLLIADGDDLPHPRARPELTEHIRAFLKGGA